MKSALIAAIVAALVAAGSSSAASHWLNGRTIRRHSIPLDRLVHQPPAGISKTKVVDGATVTIAAGGSGVAEADCPNGWTLLGGGGYTDSGVLFESDVATNGQGWQIQVDNAGYADAASANAEAICGQP